MTYTVCLQHDRYWPCKKLEPKDRPHLWVDCTVHYDYAEGDE